MAVVLINACEVDPDVDDTPLAPVADVNSGEADSDADSVEGDLVDAVDAVNEVIDVADTDAVPSDVAVDSDGLDADANDDGEDGAEGEDGEDVAEVEDATDASVEIVQPVDELGFVRVPVAAIDAHDVATEGVPANGFAYGYGVAPLDADGDGDLDLFLGSVPGSSVAACVYENVSSPGMIAFSTREEWCAPVELHVVLGTGVDLENDGIHELVAASETAVYVFSAATGWLTDDPIITGDSCIVGPMAAIDEDWDGLPEVVVGCMPDNRRPGGVGGGPSVTVQISPGDLGIIEKRRTAFSLDENALCLGIVDANADGLLDLVSVVDTFGSPEGFSPDITPSALLQRCPPTETCKSERLRFGAGPLAWGSHMGFEVMTDRAGNDVYWLADRAAPRPTIYADGQFVPAEVEVSLPPFGTADEWVDAWGLVAGDWNADGYTDLFVTTGNGSPARSDGVNYRDGVLLGVPTDAPNALEFVHDPELSAQLESPDDHIDPIHQTTRASRAALHVDFDLDGVPELLVAAANGPPFLYQVEGAPRHCTLRPRSNTVVSWGAGYRLLRPDGVWESGPVHGEVLSTDPPWLLTEHTQGLLRFPSGAEVPYDCRENTVVDVVEPEWLRHDRSDDTLNVTIDESSMMTGIVDLVEIWVESDGSGALHPLTNSEGVWTTTSPAATNGDRGLLRINGVWLARWLELGD